MKVRPGAREVVATYTIDEASMELIIRMAPNHPLFTVTVEDHRRVGVSVAQWRNWLLGVSRNLSSCSFAFLEEFYKHQNMLTNYRGYQEDWLV